MLIDLIVLFSASPASSGTGRRQAAPRPRNSTGFTRGPSPDGGSGTFREGTRNCLSPEIERPRYRRDALTPGIVHIGVGNVHGAVLAWYLHRLLQHGQAQDWTIVGAGVRTGDAAICKWLLAQDCLTTLVELCPDGSSAGICGSMIGFLPVEVQIGSLIAQMTDPGTRVAFLAVTESGYVVHPATGSFAPDHPGIVFDIAHSETPRTAFGAVVAALAKRRAAGARPFTIQSCDNLRGYGDITRSTVVSLARLPDPDLAGWIDAGCSFPNPKAECAVSATGLAETALARALGVDDAPQVTDEDDGSGSLRMIPVPVNRSGTRSARCLQTASTTTNP